MSGANASMCPKHWEELKQEVKDQGLWGFVAQSGDEVAKKMVAGAAGPSRESFEPLLGAHNMILSNALGRAGAFNGCPMCNVGDPDWIKLAVNGQLEHAREHGYLVEA